MKKLFLLIIIVLLITACIVPTAFASSDEYVIVENDNTVFYSTYYDPLFYVPQNCYVKLLGETNNYLSVEYHGVKGYISKNAVNLDNKTSAGTQFYHTALDATVSSNDTLILSKPTVIGSITVDSLQQNTPLFPIGKYNDGTRDYVYVSYTPQNGSTVYGAVLAGNLIWDGVMTAPTNNTSTPTNPSTPPAETPDTEGTGSENPDLTPETKDPENNLVRILLIIGICVPALIIVYLIFKPVKPSSNRYASDNPRRKEDFEDFE